MKSLARFGARRLFRSQKCIIFLLATSFVLCMIMGMSALYSKDLRGGLMDWFPVENKESNQIKEHRRGESVQPQIATVAANPEANHKISQQKQNEKQANQFPKPNYNLHAFYYPWYGHPDYDGTYLHWNHPLLKHWDKKQALKWPSGRHEPPDDIGSDYYPQLGAYSSRNPSVIEDHMTQLRIAGIGVISVSWYPPPLADDNGNPWDNMIPLLMDIAHKYDIKVCFHLEPYKNRTHKTIKSDVTLLIKKYSKHPGFYKHTWRGEELPLYYIYDSYQVGKEFWGSLLRPDGALSIRGTPQDGLFIGLLVEEKHRVDLVGAGFDGFYTYFASDGFTYGSSTRNWGSIASYAKNNNVMFIPSAGPGYTDVRVRPWNARNSKDRENGGYYEQSMKAAVAANPPIISVTSFNEWHEGTQIERAVPYKTKQFTYKDYQPMDPDYYLTLTRKWSYKYAKLLKT